jgi:hypothetical protein
MAQDLAPCLEEYILEAWPKFEVMYLADTGEYMATIGNRLLTGCRHPTKTDCLVEALEVLSNG